MDSLQEILIKRDGYSQEDAVREIAGMRERVIEGENPETLLFEIGLEPDYIFDLIF